MIDIKDALGAILPKHWLESFDIAGISELEKEWQIRLIEKGHLIPEKLKGKEAVQNGYMNPVEIEDYPLRGKTTYLKFIRRRWKERGGKDSFANEYDFHPEGMKATKEFGAFLKGLDRDEADLLFGHRPGSGA